MFSLICFLNLLKEMSETKMNEKHANIANDISAVGIFKKKLVNKAFQHKYCATVCIFLFSHVSN